MMSRLQFVLLFLALSRLAIAQEAATQPATKPSDLTVSVQSLRVSRARPETTRRFRRPFNESEAGISMLLQIDTNDYLLSPERDAVSIETFVDDTYQSLLASGREQQNYNGINLAPAISMDNKSIQFGLQSSISPALGAQRAFVRGSLRMRAVRGKVVTDTAKLPATVGSHIDIGAIKASVRSVSDDGRGSLSIQVALEGDTGLILRASAVGVNNRSLGGTDQLSSQDDVRRPVWLNFTMPAATEALTLEIMRAEKIERVRIPFETQIEFGNGKAGPIETLEQKPAAADEKRRPWPPVAPAITSPRIEGRPVIPFVPVTAPSTSGSATQPAVADIAAGATVELFSLAIGKPAPEESTAVKWMTPPAAPLQASGFTAARLMLSVPEGRTVSVGPDAITVTRFEDDKSGKLSTARFATPGDRYGTTGVYRSIGNRQALTSLSLVRAPTPGATRCTIAGTVHATINGDFREATSDPMKVEAGQTATLGPVTASFNHVGMAILHTPDGTSQQKEISVILSGNVNAIRAIDVIDARNIVVSHLDMSASQNLSSGCLFGLPLLAETKEPVNLRVRYNNARQEVDLPFEINTGVGL